MSKRVMIGLFALSLVALVWTDADAGCTPCCPRVCASWITGSGYPTGLVTVDVKDFTSIDKCDSISDACCPDVSTFQWSNEKKDLVETSFPVLLLPLTLRLLGNAGNNCGFGKDEKCLIEGFAVCGTFTTNKVTIPGPLTVESGEFVQSDGSTNSANLRFQIDSELQHSKALCGTDTFQAFIAREAFFEVRVGVLGSNATYCNRQFCTVGAGGINNDVPQIYSCKQLAASVPCK